MSLSHYEACPKCRSWGRDQRGDNLAVYDDGGVHCFACGFHRGSRFAPQTLKKEEPSVSKSLPSDFSREVPAAAWKWLLQYGLGYRYWLPFVGWSEKDSRLVFRFSDFSTGRYIESSGGACVAVPDGNHASRRKWFAYGEQHRTPQIFRPKADDIPGAEGQSTRVVLVEDPISAHKVGHLQTCIPLFGTEIFDACLPVLRHFSLPITIWLDSDQQGTQQRKAARVAILTGLPTTYLTTKLDPKSLSFDQIKEALKQ